MDDADFAAAQSLAREPVYDEPAWVDAYAMALGLTKPEPTRLQCTTAAPAAWKKHGWANPKMCAYVDG